MRKLVTLQKIAEIRPIEGADNIEVVIVGGWQCVAKKGEFSVGSPCLYYEVDSVLPMETRYEFLKKSGYVKKDWIEGYRLKTCKLRGQVSQGLALPLSLFSSNEIIPTDPIGTDLTEVLNVKLWDPPVPAALAGQIKGNFPTWMPRTDQPRIQNLYDQFKSELKLDHVFEQTLKIDGSSMVLYSKDHLSGVCSRNLELKTGEENAGNTFVKMYHKYIDGIKKLDRNLAFQGELMGPGIQGNREKLVEHEWYVFDVFDIDAQSYLPDSERIQLVKAAGLKHVPILGYFCPLSLPLGALLELSDKEKSINHPIAEGIVYKSVSDPNISFKVISNKFLLKEE